MKWIKFEQIGSTNDYAKSKRSEGEELIISARRQTGGRGTKGRSFVSDEGGVYLSTLRFYRDFSARDAFKIMSGAAVAVCETLRAFGITPVIKWANDIFVNGKKICGILIENTLSGDKISSSVVGVGLNVNNRFDGELAKIATSLTLETGKTFSVEEIECVLARELFQERTMDEYRAYLGFMGERVTLVLGDERVPATLLCVNDEGGLVAEINGERRTFSSAEVSLKIC